MIILGFSLSSVQSGRTQAMQIEPSRLGDMCHTCIEKGVFLVDHDLEQRNLVVAVRASPNNSTEQQPVQLGERNQARLRHD